jgi:phytoene/squalene synthetase
MIELFDSVSIRCSRLATKAYSTSFSLGILCLEKQLRNPIYSIYGFVRFADEIVDSFHQYDKHTLLSRFRDETYTSIEEKISLNPILNSFQATVNEYGIEHRLIEQFLKSMEMDLAQTSYDGSAFDAYVLGSAEVVGLMCLRVFTKKDHVLYDHLTPYAMSLGAAFQKINFLRDLNADYIGMGRSYFPGVNLDCFDEKTKKEIEYNIAKDFSHAFKGIKKLPRAARFGVYVAYVYYLALFKKIRNMPSDVILNHRIRIRNRHKATLLAYSFVKHRLNMI